MYGQLFGLLLIASQIILNESSSSSSSSEDSSSESVSAEDVATRPPLPSPLPAADSEGYVPFADVHASYKLYEDPVESWFVARDRCIEYGRKLVVPDTVEKIKHIHSLRTKLTTDKWVHAGIYRDNVTDKWVRADNDQEVTDIPWIENNPDSTGDCAGVSIELNGLVSYGCTWSDEYFACEKPIGEN